MKLRSDFAQVLNIENGSDKLIIVLHEIYGINKHITDICDLLSEQDFDVICPNLLDKNSPYDYSEEEEAYQNFMYKLGFTHALQKVKKIILEKKEHYSKIFIIGFSIGATIAWLGSQEKSVDGVIGYYGSRIRDYLYIYPNCSTLLFFSIEEKSFNVDKIIPTLEKKDVRIHICKCQHGFSDPYTPKYHKESAEYAFRETLNFLKLV
jgi:dienelactone hydrolase